MKLTATFLIGLVSIYIVNGAIIPESLPVGAKALKGNYIDKKYQNIRFGEWSADMFPFRAWCDTRTADTVLNAVGINFNLFSNKGKEIERVAHLLGLAGVTTGRIEIGMGSFKFDNPNEFISKNTAENLRRRLLALRRNGIRPLICLNSNSHMPYPMRSIKVKLVKPARKGDREIFIKDTSNIRPEYTGLQAQAYQAAYPLIMKIKSGGRCILSAPIAKPLPAGKITLQELKYQPFADGSVLADGTPNPGAEETIKGWGQFILRACKFVRKTLGTKGMKDSGFDVEIWNEYSFGSQHLLGLYYSPKRQYKKRLSRTKDGITVKGREVILPVAVNIITAPKNNFPGVRILSGLANQRPWDNGADMWPGQYGISRHYYCGATGKFRKPYLNQPAINALGNKEKPVKYFPKMIVDMPEYWLTALQTEMMSRDLQPYPNPFLKHFRFSLNVVGDYAKVWMTEYNFYRGAWSKKIQLAAKVSSGNRRFTRLVESLATRALLRSAVFLPHKGVEAIQYYAAKAKMTDFGLISEKLYNYLPIIPEGDDKKLIAASGEQIKMLINLNKFMKNSDKLAVVRKVEIGKIIEHKPLELIKGNNTKEHPSKFARDMLAILPFQLSANRYAIGIYVVTPNIVKVWDRKRKILDPKRYKMPPQWFDIEFKNINGQDAICSIYDPIKDRREAVEIVKSSPNSIMIRLAITDCPKMLEIREKTAGPLILRPKLLASEVSFKVNIPGRINIQWGKFSQRQGKGNIKLDAKANKNYSIELKNITTGDGVRITLTANKLKTIWPQWDYNPIGAILKTKYNAIINNMDTDNLILPKLPKNKRPDKLKVTRDIAPLRFNIVNDIDSLLPSTVVTDRVDIKTTLWNGVDAWIIDTTLDPAAHPGEKFLRRRTLIAPLRKGYASLELRSGLNDFEQKLEKFKQVSQKVIFTK